MKKFNIDKVEEACADFRLAMVLGNYESPGEKLAANRNTNRIIEDVLDIVEKANRDTVLNRQLQRIVELQKERLASSPGSWAYEKADLEMGHLMLSVATILAHGRLKGYIRSDSKFKNVHLDLKSSIVRWFNKNGLTMDRLLDSLDRITVIGINKDHDLVTVCLDADLERKIMKEIADLASTADAQTLVSESYTELMRWVAEVDEDTDVLHLLMPRPKLIEKDCVYSDGTVKDRALWQYGCTNAIHESSAVVGRYLNSLIKTTNNNVALDDTEVDIYDPVAGEDVTVRKYRRVSQYAMDGDADDMPQPNQEMTNLIDRVLKEADLTPKQRTMFYDRYVRCWSMVHICDALKISEENYTKTWSDEIYPKLRRFFGAENVSQAFEKKAIMAYDKAEYELKGTNADAAGYWESIGQASAETGVRKSHISECVRGKRYSAGGYFWIEVTAK